MAKIKVIRGGCGISYKDEHGADRHALRTAEDGPFECDEQQASRLVSLGVAEYADEQQAAAPAIAEATPEGEEPIAGTLDPDQLKDMSLNQLKELAADMGADVKGCKSKGDYINAITALEVEAGDEDDDLPDLGAADPE
jgi:hypothetical protein